MEQLKYKLEQTQMEADIIRHELEDLKCERDLLFDKEENYVLLVLFASILLSISFVFPLFFIIFPLYLFVTIKNMKYRSDQKKLYSRLVKETTQKLNQTNRVILNLENEIRRNHKRFE